MKVINIIPDMPENWTEGDTAPWRDTLGYAWQNLDKKIPGHDVRKSGGVSNQVERLARGYDGYMVTRNGISYRYNGNPVDFDPGDILAMICGQWPGSGEYLVVAGQPPKATPAKKQEQSAPRDQGPGWCDDCGSYCYGDCQANG